MNAVAGRLTPNGSVPSEASAQSKGCVISACILAVFVATCLWFFGHSVPLQEKFVPKHPGRFDTAEWLWLGGPDRPVSERQTMLGDLRANHLRRGMGTGDLTALLGEPSEYAGQSNRQWKYIVDVRHGADSDEYSYLVVSLDGDAKVESTAVVGN